MMLLTVTCVLLVSTALCIVFYMQFSSAIMREIRNRAETFVDNSSQTAIDALAITKSSDMRVTIVAPDGTVVFDNAVAERLPNHSGRREIQDALENGFGQSVRHSDTLGTETVYFAIKLTDGYILRTSKTSSSILGVFIRNLPVAVCIFFLMVVIGYLFAGQLTKRIVAPLVRTSADDVFNAPYDELAPYIKTITEQREKIALQLSDLQIRSDIISAIMRNMNEGIILINTHGIILSANESILRLFEKESSVEGKNILEILRDVSFSEGVRRALSGTRGEMVFGLKSRTYRVYFSHVEGGGAIVLFLDITEKAEAEKLRREFSANVSHELKTPLTSIYAGAEMLFSGIVREIDKPTFYAQIKNEAGRLIALIEDILMLSKLDESGRQESFERISLKDAAAEAVEALSQKAVEENITVIVTGEDARLKANRSLIYEMFYNLIDNAIKYNKPSGSVNIDFTKLEKTVKITIADTGIGIPEEAQSRVFERFYRVDKSRSKKTGGTGLGLAIVKHIVLVHGGEIKLSSRENEGTAITIAFRPMTN